MITLQAITEENFLKAASLRVSAEQKDFVAPAALIIARAYAYRNQRSICWSIYHNRDMIGLAMLHDMVEEPSCYHLAELMIDEAYQNLGYGQQALKLILEHCFIDGKFPAIEVCVKRSNIAAIHIYEKAGFRDTGYIDSDAPESLCMMLDLQAEISVEVRYKDIVLRDRKLEDIEDWVRWNTVEIEWMDWDGPDIPSDPFEESIFRKKILAALKNPKIGQRCSFEIDTAGGTHIGMVNSYRIDQNWQCLNGDSDSKGIGLALGVDICENVFWNKGYGSHALAAFVRYLLGRNEQEIYLQTWSGNIRMIRVAQRLGFVECNRFVGNRLIRGDVYDGLTFKLDLDSFHKYLSENT